MRHLVADFQISILSVLGEQRSGVKRTGAGWKDSERAKEEGGRIMERKRNRGEIPIER